MFSGKGAVGLVNFWNLTNDIGKMPVYVSKIFCQFSLKYMIAKQYEKITDIKRRGRSEKSVKKGFFTNF